MSADSRWRLCRVKTVTTKIGSGKTPTGGSAVYGESGTIFLRSQNIHFDGIRLDDVAYIDSETDREMKSSRVRAGDSLLNITGASLGRVARASLDLPNANVNQHVCILRPSRSIDARYLSWCLAGDGVQQQIQALQVGGNRDGLNFEQVGNLNIPLPPICEQRRISDFLDGEVNRIDQLVRCQLRTVNLLEERINNQILAIIGESGIVATSGKATIPLRRLLRKLNRATVPTGEVITAFRDGQVTARSVRRAEGYTLAASVDPQGQGVQVGDVVIHGLDGFAGAIGDSEAVGNCSPVYHVCSPMDGGNSTFYGRLLRVLAVDNYLGLFATSTRERAVDFRRWELFGSIPIPQVDPVMQHDIGNRITRIRPLRIEVSRFNERLAERRQALITAAVTGQIDVTTARGLPETDGVKV